MKNETNATSNEVKHYKKSVLELYVAAVESAVTSKKTQQQVSASGHNFTGLNNVLLANAKAERGFKSTEWFSEKQMTEAGLMLKNTDDQGVLVFTTKLVDNGAKKETALRYWVVFNKDQLEQIPL